MRCYVGVCRNHFAKTKLDEKTKHIRYHKFPKEPDRITVWMERCHREKDCKPANSFICSKHFTEDDYERDLKSELLGLDKKRRLKKTAVPTKLLTEKDLDDFLEEQVDKKLNASYIVPENKEIKIENVFSMNTSGDDPQSPLTNITEITNTEPEKVPCVVMLPYKQNKEIPVLNISPNMKPNALVTQPYEASLENGMQTVNVPVINTLAAKLTAINTLNVISNTLDPKSTMRNYNVQNISNKCVCGYNKKYEKLSLKLQNVNGKIRQLEKRNGDLKHLLLRNKSKVKDLKSQKATSLLTIKRLSKEIRMLKNREIKKEKRISHYEAAMKSVFSDNQIKLLMGKKKVVWTTEDFSKAFTLFYFSRKTYLFLKNVLGMPLPCLSTLRRTAAKYNYQGKELEGDETEGNSMES